MNQELLTRAKAAKSPEELLKIAQENGMSEFTEESAKEYFELINKSGELSDDELSNAAGGCKKGGRRIVTAITVCAAAHEDKYMDYRVTSPYWKCKVCHSNSVIVANELGFTCFCNRKPATHQELYFGIGQSGMANVCGTCEFCTRERGIWYCNHPWANEK